MRINEAIIGKEVVDSSGILIGKVKDVEETLKPKQWSPS